MPLFLGLCLLLVSFSESLAPIYQGPDIQIIGKDFYKDLKSEFNRYSYQIDALNNEGSPLSLQNITPIHQDSDIQIIRKDFYKDLESEFNRYSYQIDALENGVPPLILQNLPGDLNKIQSNKHRKSIFFKALLPMILLANDEIRVERKQLLIIAQLLSAKKLLNKQQLQTIATLSKRYKVKFNNSQPEKTVVKLLNRVDIIPEDLALAQAANESAWGTSRFSRVANNLFGQWTFIPGQGIIPEDRPAGATYEVRKFATIYDSVRSYLLNLNTHSAYKQLRKLRTGSRLNGQSPNGLKLAEGLLRYSTRGEDYVKELQAMIRYNQLGRFTTVKLRARS
ncbi:MAG: glucosaminidase domain-containing protein [Desulfuromusa sp.]|nr:glucosaminidase domain-containing protein [Desulfuromusa sp.]